MKITFSVCVFLERGGSVDKVWNKSVGSDWYYKCEKYEFF